MLPGGNAGYGDTGHFGNTSQSSNEFTERLVAYFSHLCEKRIKKAVQFPPTRTCVRRV